MRVITAELVTARQFTLVPLRAEHASEMAVVLAGRICTPSLGVLAHSPGIARTLRTVDRRVLRPRRVLVQLGDPAPQPPVPGRHGPSDDQHITITVARSPGSWAAPGKDGGSPPKPHARSSPGSSGNQSAPSSPTSTPATRRPPLSLPQPGSPPTDHWQDGEIRWRLTMTL